MPTYNHAHYLNRALQSVFDQTYDNWEIIIIDNHSTDETSKVVAKFFGPRTTYLKINNGGIIAKSRNMGIKAAKGEWVAFLDSDDWWAPEKLQVFYNHVSEKVDLIYHDMEIVSNKFRFFGRKKIKTGQVKKPVFVNLLLSGNVIGNSSVVVRKNLLDLIGGIDESKDIVAAEDYNTWLRIAQITDQFVYLPQKLGYYFIHNQSISQKDMSSPGRQAVAQFTPLLNAAQRLHLEVNFRYTAGHFNYLMGRNDEAKLDLLFCIRHGHASIKMKAFTFICLKVLRKYFMECKI